MQPADVSVVIPAYNGGALLELAVVSALEQTMQPREVIVVDDGSTDDTARRLRRLGSSIRVVSRSNGGTAAARNSGVAVATGEWIALLDQDDVWDRSKLEHQFDAPVARSVGLVHGGARFESAPGQISSVEPARSELDVHDLLSWCWLLQSTPVIRATALAAVGPFDTALSAADDWDMWIRVADRYRLLAVPHADVTVRIHEANQSHDAERMYQAASRLFTKHALIHGSHCPDCHRASTYRVRRNRQEYYRRVREQAKRRAAAGAYGSALRLTARALRRHPGALVETSAFYASRALRR